MPLVNVIRGERIDTAPFNVRTPILRLPIWLVLGWWLLRGTARVVWLACRYWYITGPLLLFGWLYTDYGWWGPVGLVIGLTAGITGWWFGHRPSCQRLVVWPAVGRWRRTIYRRRWLPAMVTTKLAVAFDGATVLPVLIKVRSNEFADTLIVRMVTGQIPDDYAKVGERLVHTFGALGIRVMPGDRPDLVVIVLRRRDPLLATVGPFPVPLVPDFTALPLGLREDGEIYALRLFGTQVLIVGATDAGKGSVIWSIVRAVAGGVRSGLVQVWGIDPKGGMELGGGESLFARFACKNFDQMADMLEEALAVAQSRADRLRGRTRQHIPTRDEPLIVIIIDELAALTAYVTDRKIKDRIKAALGLLLTQGRAVGVHVVAALQDPRKEVLPFRNLFPTRIGLRLSEASEVDLALDEGARDRGALCDRIPKGPQYAGTAYVHIDGDPAPVRVRFSYNTDEDIAELAEEYSPLRVIDGETVEGISA